LAVETPLSAKFGSNRFRLSPSAHATILRAQSENLGPCDYDAVRTPHALWPQTPSPVVEGSGWCRPVVSMPTQGFAANRRISEGDEGQSPPLGGTPVAKAQPSTPPQQVQRVVVQQAPQQVPQQVPQQAPQSFQAPQPQFQPRVQQNVQVVWMPVYMPPAVPVMAASNGSAALAAAAEATGRAGGDNPRNVGAGRQLFTEAMAFPNASIASAFGGIVDISIRQPQPSLGSALHGSGNCNPCAHYWKERGCMLSFQCDHCHLCPAGELRRRKKEKQAVIRTARMRRGGC